MFNQDKEYHLREIAGIIKVSPIYAAKELDNLAKLNLVRKSKKANPQPHPALHLQMPQCKTRNINKRKSKIQRIKGLH